MNRNSKQNEGFDEKSPTKFFNKKINNKNQSLNDHDDTSIQFNFQQLFLGKGKSLSNTTPNILTKKTLLRKSRESVESMLCRFKEKQNKLMKKIENMKKRLMEEEMESVKSIPEINKTQEGFLKQSDESLLNRFNEKQKTLMKKIEDMKKRLMEEEMESVKPVPEINKTNINFKFSQEGFLKRSEIFKSISELKKQELIEKEMFKRESECPFIPRINRRLKSSEINERVENILQWEDKKKKNIEKKRHQIDMITMKECTFRPRINITSRLLTDEQPKLTGNLSSDMVNRVYHKPKLMRKINIQEEKSNVSIQPKMISTSSLEIANKHSNSPYNRIRCNLVKNIGEQNGFKRNNKTSIQSMGSGDLQRRAVTEDTEDPETEKESHQNALRNLIEANIRKFQHNPKGGISGRETKIIEQLLQKKQQVISTK